jgi:hypothetical protein
VGDVVQAASFRLPAGEWQTHIVVWDTGDPAKAGDSRYWWLPDEVERLRQVTPPEFADSIPVAGRPKGRSLRQLRSEFGGDEGFVLGNETGIHDIPSPDAADQVVVPIPVAEGHRLSLSHWSDADPDTTHLIVSHVRGISDEEREVRERTDRLPAHVDALRRQWVAALEAGSADEPALRELYDRELRLLGHIPHRAFSAFAPRKAVQVSPGVYVQDDRQEQR